MSKTTKILIGIILVLGAGLTYSYVFWPSYEYTKPSAQTVEVVKEISELESRILSAQEAKRAEIEAEAQQDYQDKIDLRLAEIENKVIEEYKLELSSRQASNTAKVVAF